MSFSEFLSLIATLLETYIKNRRREERRNIPFSGYRWYHRGRLQTKVANWSIRSSVVGIDRIGMPRVTSHSSVTSDDGNDLWYLPTKGPRA